MNNFPHMLKIISLCSAPHSMGLTRENSIACEQGCISYFWYCLIFWQLFLLLFVFACLFVVWFCAFFSLQDGNIDFLREKLNMVTSMDPILFESRLPASAVC